jgi:hypothetical protein
MRYALHDLERSTEARFKTLKELWAHVRADDLCSEQTDVDIDGVARVEGRAPPPNVG